MLQTFLTLYLQEVEKQADVTGPMFSQHELGQGVGQRDNVVDDNGLVCR